MENMNKIVSFILGLVVVVVFLAIVSGKIKLGGKLSNITGAVKTTPTPTVSKLTLPTPQITQYNQYQTQKNNGAVKTIPATGSPTLLVPFVLTGLGSGLFLRKSGKKQA
ncbi:hypothetical protein GYA28_01810 [Candidatus Roizmanbacteria bacterium]|jgi:amino acid transporter|nr:hypothetical protein [Candidatus Roizmanbacteria bacterium]